MSAANPKPKELAERLADPAFRAEIEQAIQRMPPEQAAELVALLEDSIRRRKLELIGYLAAAVVVLVGMVVALYVFGSSGRDTFVGWVFLIPLAIAGLIMVWVGRLARPRAGRAPARPGARPEGEPQADADATDDAEAADDADVKRSGQ